MLLMELARTGRFVSTFYNMGPLRTVDSVVALLYDITNKTCLSYNNVDIYRNIFHCFTISYLVPAILDGYDIMANNQNWALLVMFLHKDKELQNLDLGDENKKGQACPVSLPVTRTSV